MTWWGERRLVTNEEWKARHAKAREQEKRGRPQDKERDAGEISGFMLDEDGFVKPEWREHVARLRIKPEMSDIGEVMQAAQARFDKEGSD